MPTNYKYIDHDKAVKPRWRPRILLLLILLVLIAFALYGACFFQTRRIDEQILIDQYDQASMKLERWQWLPLVSTGMHEKLGTAKLLQNGSAQALPFFQKAEGGPFFHPIAIWQEVLKILWSNGRYDDGAV